MSSVGLSSTKFFAVKLTGPFLFKDTARVLVYFLTGGRCTAADNL